MAVSATVALSQSTGSIHTPITALVTISNSGGAPVNVTTVQPQIAASNDSEPQDASSFSVGQATINPANQTVNASGTSQVTFSVVFHAPAVGSKTYNIGGIVCTNDGTILNLTPATVTIASLP